ncbi:MAG: nitronate monooxygenase [Candidatus Pelagadaptatus aseana]|uniref:NAD(P)H-dependent flavin oxidoreductase n=1 Tax=Candidatus Pelagadaptatus aseana TaxID=3120508 RepID=UPI0039B1C7E8
MATQLCQRLGIVRPIIQAPMAGSQNWQLAVAVSEAGGLGSIPCGMLNADQVVAEIQQFTRHSDKPYNLNFFCHTMPAMTPQVLSQWQQCLEGYYDELDVQPPETVSGLRLPYDDAVADRLEAYKPPVISFHFGLPSAQQVARIKSWGSLILSSATTVEEGLWLERHGADVVIAQGVEAGGHRAMFLTDDPGSQLGTIELVRALKRTLQVPVVAAGGIAAADDVEAMLALGVAAVQVGTAYLLCDEAKTSAVHREALHQALKAGTATTALTNLFSGRLARGISNRLMRDLDCVSDKAPAFPYAAVAIGPLRARAESQGRGDFSPLWSGTNTSGCQPISAGQLTHQLWPES